MIKIFDMVNGIFETPGNPDVPLSTSIGSPVAESATIDQREPVRYLPEDMLPSLQEAPLVEDSPAQPELPPALIEIAIDKLIRRR